MNFKVEGQILSDELEFSASKHGLFGKVFVFQKSGAMALTPPPPGGVGPALVLYTFQFLFANAIH